MATTKKSAAGDRKVTRSATIPVEGITIDDILAAASDLGAPNTATVAVGGNYSPNDDGENPYPHAVTLTWEDTL